MVTIGDDGDIDNDTDDRC